MTTLVLDPRLFKTKPFKHQMNGIRALVTHPYFALFDEMGVGKSYQVINAACVLYENNVLDTVVIACPAQVKSVWMDEDLGEIQKHAWVESTVHHFNGGHLKIEYEPHRLNWIVVSYEFARIEERLHQLLPQLRTRKTFLVMDESIFLKNPKAKQTKAIFKLSETVDRKVLLNGTPDGGNILNLYCQFKMLNPMILECSTWYHFRARYCVMGGFQSKQVVGFKNQEQVVKLTAPHLLRRLKKDCLDLPEKLPPTHLSVPLTPENWRRYKSMRDDLVVWLKSKACLVQHAVTKTLRLAQITSGFLGGIAETPEEFQLFSDIGMMPTSGPKETVAIGREKLDLMLNWLQDRFEENRNFRVLIWGRFRPELDRYEAELAAHKFLGHIPVFSIRGGQSKTKRDQAKREGEVGQGPVIILGQPHAGGLGLNLTSLSCAVYVSRDHSLFARQQSEDRIHRPGQTQKVSYVDIIATGPDGQKTLDHAIVKALQNKQNIAAWTTDAWREALELE